MREDIHTAAYQTGEQLRQYYETHKAEAQDLAATVSDHIRKKPVQSVLIATGVGFLLASLLRR